MFVTRHLLGDRQLFDLTNFSIDFGPRCSWTKPITSPAMAPSIAMKGDGLPCRTCSRISAKELRLFLELRTLKSMNDPEHCSDHARAFAGAMAEGGGCDTFLTLCRRNIDQD